ncbi:MAG: phage baseplate protein [Dehalococcoidia bacterium]|nr:phage baseplate protein [Dehalococcoidia bacterium]
MERALDAQEMLQLWEAGRNRHPLDRAVQVLSASSPSTHAPGLPSVDALQRLSVGARDARLLEVHRSTFGDRLDGRASCPACAESLEVSLTCSTLLAAGDTSEDDRDTAHLVVVEAGYRVTFRLPDSRDLAAIATLAEVSEARALLLQRCVTEVARPGDADPGAPPEAVVLAVAARMAEADPHAELLLDLECPACDTSWQAPLDVTLFLWARISGQARRLLLEVDAIARVYGWREAEILALSPARRATYLELAVG